METNAERLARVKRRIDSINAERDIRRNRILMERFAPEARRKLEEDEGKATLLGRLLGPLTAPGAFNTANLYNMTAGIGPKVSRGKMPSAADVADLALGAGRVVGGPVGANLSSSPLLARLNASGKVDPSEEFHRALVGKRPVTGADILGDNFGVKNKWVQTLGGLAIDLGTDPLTPMDAGLSSATKMGKLSRLAELSDEVIDAKKLASLGIGLKGVAAKYGGDLAKALEFGVKHNELPNELALEIGTAVGRLEGAKRANTVRTVGVPFVRRTEQGGLALGAQLPWLENAPRAVAKLGEAGREIEVGASRLRPTLKPIGAAAQGAEKLTIPLGHHVADRGGVKMFGQTVLDVQPQMDKAAWLLKNKVLRKLPGAQAIEQTFNTTADMARTGNIIADAGAKAALRARGLGVSVGKNIATREGDALLAQMTPDQLHEQTFARDLVDPDPELRTDLVGQRYSMQQQLEAKRKAWGLTTPVQEARAIAAAAAPVEKYTTALAATKAEHDALLAQVEEIVKRNKLDVKSSAALGRAISYRNGTAKGMDYGVAAYSRDVEAAASEARRMLGQALKADERAGVAADALVTTQRDLEALATDIGTESAVQSKALGAWRPGRPASKPPTIGQTLEQMGAKGRRKKLPDWRDIMDSELRQGSSYQTFLGTRPAGFVTDVKKGNIRQSTREKQTYGDVVGRFRSEYPSEYQEQAVDSMFQSRIDEAAAAGDQQLTEHLLTEWEKAREYVLAPSPEVPVDPWDVPKADATMQAAPGNPTHANALDPVPQEWAKQLDRDAQGFPVLSYVSPDRRFTVTGKDRAWALTDAAGKQLQEGFTSPLEAQRYASNLPAGPGQTLGTTAEQTSRDVLMASRQAQRPMQTRLDALKGSEGRLAERATQEGRRSEQLLGNAAKAEARGARSSELAADILDKQIAMADVSAAQEAAHGQLRSIESQLQGLRVKAAKQETRLRVALATKRKLDRELGILRTGDEILANVEKQLGDLNEQVSYKAVYDFFRGLKNADGTPKYSDAIARDMMQVALDMKAAHEARNLELGKLGLANPEHLGEGMGAAGYGHNTEKPIPTLFQNILRGVDDATSFVERKLTPGEAPIHDLLGGIIASRDDRAAARVMMEQTGIDARTLRKSDRLGSGFGSRSKPQQPKLAEHKTVRRRLDADLETQTNIALAYAAKVEKDYVNIARAQFEDTITRRYGTQLEGDAKPLEGEVVWETTRHAADGTKVQVRWSVPPEVQSWAKSLDRVFVNDEAGQFWLRTLDRIQNLWKRMATSWNPAFHGRNLISNYFMAWAQGLGKPQGWIDAAEVMAAKSDAQFTFHGVKQTAGAWRQQFAEDGVLKGVFGPPESREMMQRTLMRSESPMRGLNPSYVGGEVGSYVEDTSRVAAYLNASAKGLDRQAASMLVDHALYNYSSDQMTAMGAQVGKRVVPFWSWISQNLPRMVELTAKEPRRVVWLYHLRNNAFAANPVDEESMPDYMKRQMSMPTPFKDAQGNTLMWSPNLPIGDLGRFDEAGSIAGNISPLVMEPAARLFNKDLFTGDTISTPSDPYARAPGYVQRAEQAFAGTPIWERLKDKLGMVERTDKYTGERAVYGDARNLHSLKAMSPFLANIGKAVDTKPQAAAARQSLLTGIKLTPAEEKKWQELATYEEMQRFADEMTRLRGLGQVPSAR